METITGTQQTLLRVFEGKRVMYYIQQTCFVKRSMSKHAKKVWWDLNQEPLDSYITPLSYSP